MGINLILRYPSEVLISIGWGERLLKIIGSLSASNNYKLFNQNTSANSFCLLPVNVPVVRFSLLHFCNHGLLLVRMRSKSKEDENQISKHFIIRNF
jgi:hypothetical protein